MTRSTNEGELDIPEAELPAEAVPIRRIQPGDILDVVVKMRQLMSMYETCSYTLYASFDDLELPELNVEAQKARHTLELATARMASLLSVIERTKAYTDLRKKTLDERKTRRDKLTHRLRKSEETA